MEYTQSPFTELGLSSKICKTLEGLGFENPTEIQEKAIPVVLNQSDDVVALSQTGTGKTAAYGLPLLDQLAAHSSHVQALILVPTRELAIQVAKDLTQFSPDQSQNIVPVFGGGSIEKQAQQLKRSKGIVVGTPGRIRDHIRRKRLDLSQLKTLVLDEADEMLNRGFVEELEDILSVTNEERRIVLFSATMPPYILSLAERCMGEYTQISVAPTKKLSSKTDHMFYEVLQREKTSALVRILDIYSNIYTIVFCRTRVEVDIVSESLVKSGYPAAGIHGDFSQSQRNRVLDGFRNKSHKILVATDVAARGLDITNLTHVINYSLPQDVESYVHRSGRTGRAGKSGIAISLIAPSEHKTLRFFQKKLATTIEKKRIPTIESIQSSLFNRLIENYQSATDEKAEEKYVEIAQELLKNKDAETALASILQHLHKKEEPKQHYPKVTDLYDTKQSRYYDDAAPKKKKRTRFSDKRRRSRSYS